MIPRPDETRCHIVARPSTPPPPPAPLFLADVRMSPVTPGPVRRVPQPLEATWTTAGVLALAGLTFGGGLVLGMIVGGLPK